MKVTGKTHLSYKIKLIGVSIFKIGIIKNNHQW